MKLSWFDIAIRVADIILVCVIILKAMWTHHDPTAWVLIITVMYLVLDLLVFLDNGKKRHEVSKEYTRLSKRSFIVGHTEYCRYKIFGASSEFIEKVKDLTLILNDFYGPYKYNDCIVVIGCNLDKENIKIFEEAINA